MTRPGTRPGPLGELLILVGIGAALGVVAQYTSPARIPWQEDWSSFVQTKALQAGLPLADVADVERMVADPAWLLLDARPLADFSAGHLPGALSLPESDLDRALPGLAPLLTPGQKVLVYCSGHACDESLRLSLFLRGRGMTNVVLFVGGMSAWQEAGKQVQQ